MEMGNDSANKERDVAYEGAVKGLETLKDKSQKFTIGYFICLAILAVGLWDMYGFSGAITVLGGYGVYTFQQFLGVVGRATRDLSISIHQYETYNKSKDFRFPSGGGQYL